MFVVVVVVVFVVAGGAGIDLAEAGAFPGGKTIEK
jgi:hypothetical protein